MILAEAFQEYLWRIISTPFIRFDWWDVIGFIGQFVFFSRFVVQWWESEKKQRNVLPLSFWYLSISGALITILYYIHLGKLPLICAGFLSIFLYVRNLRIYYKRRSRRGFAVTTGPVAENADEK